MTLRYQGEIDNLNFSISCPNNVSPISSAIEVYRFSFAPIEHQLNFLPNVVFDRINGGRFNYSQKDNELTVCRRCGASFYHNPIIALGVWKNIPPKRKENLKYTHLAKGLLVPGDGLITEADDDTHFGFYESTNNDTDYLKKKFELIDPL